MSSKSSYILGHSENEVQRLITQADLYRPLTERILREAGIAEGMRVLDLGCGGGDVSFLIARLVGNTGSVLGVDRAAMAVETAARRAQEQRKTNVSFSCSEFQSLDMREGFDAVVGRLILHHQSDPVATVHRAAAQVRKGGLIVFHELDLTLRQSSSWPIVPIFEKCLSLTALVQERCGLHIDIGKRLYYVFKAAGLPEPQMRLERAIGAGVQWSASMAAAVAGFVYTLWPKIEELGLATADEVQIETLEERIEAALCEADAVTLGVPMVGAWVPKA